MAGRGRPRLPIGTYGSIDIKAAPHSTKKKPVYVARARFRDSDGVTRPVTKSGPTQNSARLALTEALSKRAKKVAQSTVSTETTVADLAVAWQRHHEPDWATNTAGRYKISARHLTEELGAVRLHELSRAGINKALERIRDSYGVRSAQVAKSALSGMCKYAMLFDALDANPVRDTITISAGRTKPPDALTPEQADELCDKLRTDKEAVERYDLADLIEWILGTGCRIGEACAARYVALDMDAGTWEINATAVRVPKVGMTIQERPKTTAGWRVLALPSFALTMLRRREQEERWSKGGPVVFGSPYSRTIRDPSNTSADLRVLLKRHGFEWVTFHTLRRTAATRLEEGGMTARQISYQLGHAHPSMTQEKYLARPTALPEAANILDR